MNKVKFMIEDEFGSRTKVSDTREGGYLDDVLLTVVRGLLGATFSEDLIKQYINYDSENYQVLKIGE